MTGQWPNRRSAKRAPEKSRDTGTLSPLIADVECRETRARARRCVDHELRQEEKATWIPRSVMDGVTVWPKGHQLVPVQRRRPGSFTSAGRYMSAEFESVIGIDEQCVVREKIAEAKWWPMRRW